MLLVLQLLVFALLSFILSGKDHDFLNKISSASELQQIWRKRSVITTDDNVTGHSPNL